MWVAFVYRPPVSAVIECRFVQRSCKLSVPIHQHGGVYFLDFSIFSIAMKAHLEYLKFKASYSKFTTAADAIAVLLAGHVLLLAKHSRQCSLRFKQ